MAIFHNNDSGLAEDLPVDQGIANANAGTHSVYMMDPDNKPVTVEYRDMPHYASQGYRQPNSQEFQGFLDHAKHATPIEQAKTFAESMGRSLSFGTSDALEIAMGADPKDIRQRREVNPGVDALGTVAGIVGPGAVEALTGVGLPAEASALTALGKSAEGLFGGAEATTALGRAGRSAARVAAENAAFTAGNELSKAIEQDPEAGVGAAISHTLLSGAIGGVLGAGGSGAKDLWESTVGAKLAPYLESFQKTAAQSAGGTLEAAPDQLDLNEKVMNSISKKVSPWVAAKLGSFLGSFVGHPLLGGSIGYMASKFAGEVPSAIGYGLLKALGGAAETVPSALKATINFASNVERGTNNIRKSVGYLFSDKDAENLYDPITDSQKNKIESAAEMYQKDPSQFLNVAGDLGTHLPDHASIYGSTISNGLQAVIDAKPKSTATGILDQPTKPSKIETANYNRTLQIVNNPQTALYHLSKGTILPSDVELLKSVHPGAYKIMSQEVWNHMVESQGKGQNVPYKQRLALSMFMGMPLDSTMTPMAIASNQPQPVAAPQGPKAPGGGHGSKNALTKMPGMYTTSEQSREAKRAMR